LFVEVGPKKILANFVADEERVLFDDSLRSCKACRENSPEDLPLSFEHTDGGMNLTGFLPDGSDDRSWSQRLAEADFDVPPLSSYAVKKTRPGLVFGFTAFPPSTIKAAFHHLQSLLPPP
jgi:DNA-binding transcriptional MocR family regulator